MSRGSVLILVTLLPFVSPLEIMSEGRREIRQRGDNVTLECNVNGTGYNMFKNPVVWYKVVANGDVTINSVGVPAHPFSKTGRYSLEPEMPTEGDVKVRMPLSIKDITLAENGTYRCDVFNAEGTVLSSVTYNMLVPAGIDSLELFTNKTIPTGDEDETVFEFKELKPAYLGCKSIGGNPQPQVKMYRGRTEITAEFQTDIKEVIEGELGLQVIRNEINVFQPDFRADVEERGERLKCVSKVPKMPELKKTVHGTIEVKYPPKFDCSHERFVSLPERDFVVDCKIHGNPRVPMDSIIWIIPDVNGTTNLTVGSSVNGYSANATTNDEDGMMDIRLTISDVNYTALQTYHVRAKNDLSETHFEIDLFEATTTTSTTTSKPVPTPKGNGLGPDDPRGSMGGTADGLRQCPLLIVAVLMALRSMTYLL